MSSTNQTAFQRRPALIPPDLHLSSEDERSILLRIGNLQLASLAHQPSSSSHDSSHDPPSPSLARNRVSLVLTTTCTRLAIPKAGTKRKASTTAEQYHELDCTEEVTLGSECPQEDQHRTGLCCALCKYMQGPALPSNERAATKDGCLGFECESLSPKDLAELASRDAFFQSTSAACL